MSFRVLVDDNFHYRDETDRYVLGDFAVAEEAVAAAKKLVDDFLVSTLKTGITTAELLAAYRSFGPDPFIVSSTPVDFSAWEYARKRCDELCPPSG